MCNVYQISRGRRTPQEWAKINAQVEAEVGRLGHPLIRRGGQGVVVLGDGEDDFRTERMRWGFHHPEHKLVNNARSDSLVRGRGMWREPVDEGRRCLVPMSAFYEWGEPVNGVKPAYEFTRADGGMMWVAGLYERRPEGAHYATITTEPTPEVAAYHDRLLAVVEGKVAMAYLRGEVTDFSPYRGELRILPCASPLKTKTPAVEGESPPKPVQGELF